MSMGLTPVQANVLKFVRERIAAGGIAPSYDEIAAHAHVSSRGNVNRIVNKLVERGALNRMPGKARALSVPSLDGTAFMVDPLPEVRRALEAYAREHRISVKVAAEEALRAYFMEASVG